MLSRILNPAILLLGLLLATPSPAPPGYTSPLPCKQTTENLDPVVREKRDQLLGRGASGKVYSWRVILESGRETIAVKKKIVQGKDTKDLERAANIYRYAEMLRWGPRVISTAKKKAPMFSNASITVYLEKINGLTLSKAGWERNTLPEPYDGIGGRVTLEEAFTEFRRTFGNYVILKDGFANMTAADYAVFLRKYNAISSVHPDPSPENIYLVVNENRELDVTFGDWEQAGSAERETEILRKLEEAHRGRFFEP